MTAIVIPGKRIAEKRTEDVKTKVSALLSRGITPGLTVIVVGENPASKVYVSRKQAACAEVGIHSTKIQLPETVTENALIQTIQQLNHNPSVHGILVQLPLPVHMSEHRVMQSISPLKDVDGFHAINQSALYAGKEGFVPCTPQGIIHLIRETGVSIEGKHAMVIGKSLIVGKPVSLLLLHEGGTVTICHSRTPDLAHHTRQADIVVAAVGKSNLVKKEMIKPGAIVIDVGITRGEDNKLVGDVDFDSVKEVAGYITPVPGGVGPMTIACLLENTLKACQNQTQNKPSSKRVCVGVIGSTKGTDMQAIIDAIESHALNAQIGMVISDVSDAFILERARTHHLPAHFVDRKSFPSRDMFDAAIAQKMREANVDIILLIGYKRIVSKPLLDAFPHRIWNIHPSLLPAFNGKFDADVHQDVLNAGVKVSGATLHIVTADVDKGPILSQQTVPIMENETSSSLKQKVQAVEMDMLVSAIRDYGEGTLNPYKSQNPQ